MIGSKVLLCYFLLSIGLVQIDAAPSDKCKTVFSSRVKDSLCGAKEYMTIQEADMDKMMDCVLRAVNIVDNTGAGNLKSLLEPMREIEVDGWKHKLNIESCTTTTMTKTLPEPQRAHAFYKCIMKTKSKKTFKEEFNKRVCGHGSAMNFFTP
ncbi:uncharacterized protein LOC128274035 [Anopheles cruzii]|uniref:uncharacterized protein LOC128274035 n=1 Tax=Anopheles cruzii TaxID=68878 RepID=UPI0022EC4B1E|nr:uncharacterized protein LOC128274035 [Anopheles cruzii]